jgi:nucleoside-diphosphate-sugar epimerase
MRVLVTGGGGFLGGAIVRLLVGRGDEVVTLQRGEYAWMRGLGVEARRGDLADADAVKRACDGVDAVMHVAAKAGVWGRYDAYHRANVVGTRNVIAACRACGVRRLVYTSSPSVVFDGRDESGIDESAPYPRRYLAHYPRTNAIAERDVLAANGDALATVALRPHLIWGPGDPHLVPRIVERAKAGKLRLVGDGSNRVDSTFIDNAAAAHVLALDRLAGAAAAPPAGKAYFISNGEPMAMAQLINGILDAAGLPPVTKRVSPRVAYAAGAVLEATHKLFGVAREPRMTRFVARQLATEHWFDLSAARRDLGYEPAVSIDEGLRRLAEALRR